MVETSDPRQDKLVILLVEDNAGDVFMVREALEEAAFPHVLQVVSDGNEAIDFLRTHVDSESRPDLMILDLNLPGKNGRQVMAEMQEEADLRQIPVAVLTTSRSESGIGSEYPSLRSTFAAKTPDFRQLVEILLRFREFASQPA